MYVSLAALFSLRAGAAAWLCSIAGSAVAIVVIYVLTVMLGLDYLSFLASIPGISGPLIERVAGRLGAEVPHAARTIIPVLMLLALAVFTWAGVACWLGIRRFHYPPLAIPGTGYLAWAVSLLLFLGVAGPLTVPGLLAAVGLSCLGAMCIVGYGLTFNAKMKARGITPRRILGLQGGEDR